MLQATDALDDPRDQRRRRAPTRPTSSTCSWAEAGARPTIPAAGQAGRIGRRVPAKESKVVHEPGRLRGHRRVRHRRRALPDDRRLRLLAFARPALRPRRGRPGRAQIAEPGRPPPTPVDRRDPAALVRVMVRDLGAPAAAPRRSSSLASIIFLDRCAGCSTAARRGRSRSQRRGISPVETALTAMGQYLPVVVLLVLATVFGAVSLTRVAAARAAPAVRAKEAPYECGIVPEPRAARALPGQLLHRGDAVHHVRHRDHVPLPVRGESTRARASTASGRSCCSRRLLPRRSSTRSPRAGSTGVRCTAARRLSSTASLDRAHHRSRRSAASALEGRGERGSRRGRWACQDVESTTDSAGSTTTSSPARSKTSSSGPAPQLDLAGDVRARVLRHRDDGQPAPRTTTSPASAWRCSAPRRGRPTS